MLGIGGAKPLSGSAEETVSCSVARVYEFIARGFFDNYPKWCPQVVELEQLSPPPVCEGAKGRQVTRDRGIDSESEFKVTTFAPETRFEISGETEPFRSSYVMTPEGLNATRVSFTFELKEIDLVMRPFQKLIRAAIEEGAAQTVENIKRLLDGGAPA